MEIMWLVLLQAISQNYLESADHRNDFLSKHICQHCIAVLCNLNYVLQLFYRNSSTQDPYLFTIPGCSPACPLKKFVELTKDVIPDDWKVECHAHRLFDFTPDVPYSSLIIFGK